MVTAVFGEHGKDGLPAKQASASWPPSWVLTVSKVALSVGAIVTVALTVDLSAAWQRTLNENLWLMAAAAVVMTIQIVVGGFRWHLILRELDAPAKALDSIRLFYIAVFFNFWLWGSVGGDVIRAWLCHRAQIKTSTAVNSVILDRVAAIAGVAILVLVTAPLFIYRVGYVAWALVPIMIAFVGLFGIFIAAHLHRLPLNWQRSRLMSAFQNLSTATRTIFIRPGAALRVLGLAVVVQIIMAVVAYVVGLSLDVGFSFLDSLMLMQPVALIAALPISVGGWGVRETAVVAFLSLVGISPSAAVSLSVQLGLLAILTTLPGGVFWLRLKHQAVDG